MQTEFEYEMALCSSSIEYEVASCSIVVEEKY